jgi:hypothetical protein
VHEEQNKRDIETQLRLKRSEADRIALIERHSRELELQKQQLQSNLKKTHQAELDKLQRQHDQRISEMQTELARSNSRREAERQVSIANVFGTSIGSDTCA